MGLSDEERRRQILERIEEFCVLDDTFMRQVFHDNLPLTQHVLRVLTGINDLVLIEQETQRDVLVAFGSKSVALDVWGKDTNAAQYDLEVQAGADLNPKRFGYYCACMKVDAIPSGKDYLKIPEIWVIVVLEHGPANCESGRAYYDMRTVGYEEGLGDAGHILYLDASYRGNDELGSLMADFCESDPDKIVDELLRERVQYLKRDPKGVEHMCRISEAIFNEGVEVGIEQGTENTRLDDLRSLVRKLDLTAEQALEVLGVARDEWPRYLALV